MKNGFRHLFGILVLSSLPAFAVAGDRHFIYNYESGVLGAGDRELETYTTYRFGKGQFYSAVDENIEFETGLGGGVQTSVYLNFTEELGEGATLSDGPVLDGISNEWKFKLADNVADSFGLGLYIEPEFEPDDFELEMKLIVDKDMGDFLWTFNILASPAFDYADYNSAFLLRPSMGFGFNISEKFFAGLEAMDENFYDGQPMRSVVSAGPVLEYSGTNWWVAVTLMPQLANIGSGSLDFQDSQRDQVRVATSFSL